MFWKLPNNKLFAFVPRSGSTAWAQAIVDTFYPELQKKQHRVATPSGEPGLPQFVLERVRFPKEGELYGILRDPIERFKSGYSRAVGTNVSTDDFIKSLKNSKNVNAHIKPITSAFSRNCETIKWYIYETQLEQLAKDLGLAKIPEVKNKSPENAKPTLSDVQVNLLKEFYAKDIELYNKVKAAIVVVPPVEPTVAPATPVESPVEPTPPTPAT
jgi:hypothetical protein